MPDANQSEGKSLQQDVVDITERRKLDRAHEMADHLKHMVQSATCDLIEHPTELGDFEGVSPTGWSRARSNADDNYAWKMIAAMLERMTEGADPELVLRYALLPLAVHQMFRAAAGDPIDVPDAIQSLVEEMARAHETITRVIMDGVVEVDEKRMVVSVCHALRAAAREGESSMGQTTDQVELWPARCNGART